MSLEYFDNYFVVCENLDLFLHKNVGERPKSTSYGYEQKERNLYKSHKLLFNERIHEALSERKKVPKDRENEVMTIKFPVSPGTLEIAKENGIKNIIGFISKEQHQLLFGSRD